MKRKRGQHQRKALSEVVSTVMLIVIAVIGISVVAAFIIPFVNKTQNADCFDARDHLTFVGELGGQYTCWKSDGSYTTVIVKRGSETVGLNGFRLVLGIQGQSKSYDVIWGANNDHVAGIDNYLTYSTNIPTAYAQPEKEQARGSEYTYYIKSSDFAGISPIIRAQISPILKSGETCSMTDSIEISPCP